MVTVGSIPVERVGSHILLSIANRRSSGDRSQIFTDSCIGDQLTIEVDVILNEDERVGSETINTNLPSVLETNVVIVIITSGGGELMRFVAIHVAEDELRIRRNFHNSVGGG